MYCTLTLSCSVFVWHLKCSRLTNNVHFVCTTGCNMDFISAVSGFSAAQFTTSIFLQHEIHKVADCRHRTPGDQQDNAHLLKSLITTIQRLEDLLYQLHVYATYTHSDKISSMISDTLSLCAFILLTEFYSTCFLCSRNSCLGVFLAIIKIWLCTFSCNCLSKTRWGGSHFQQIMSMCRLADNLFYSMLVW